MESNERGGLGMDRRETNALFERDTTPFRFAAEGTRNAGDPVDPQHPGRVIGLLKGILFYRQFLLIEDARKFFMESPELFYYAINDSEGSSIIGYLKETYNISFRSIQRQTQTLASRGYDYLFQHMSLKDFIFLIERLRDSKSGLVVNDEDLKARFHSNLFGFLFGNRINSVEHTFVTRAPTVRVVARHLTSRASMVPQIILMMRNWGWDMQALNTVQTENTDENLKILTEVLGSYAAEPPRRVTFKQLGPIRLRELLANLGQRGQLVVHRASDIPNDHYRKIMTLIRETLTPRELHDFFTNDFINSLNIIYQISYNLRGNGELTLDQVRASLIENLPAFRSCTRLLVAALQTEMQKGVMSPQIKRLVAALDAKRYLLPQTLVLIKQLRDSFSQSRLTIDRSLIVAAVRAMSEQQIERLPTDRYGLYCTDKMREAALLSAEGAQ